MVDVTAATAWELETPSPATARARRLTTPCCEPGSGRGRFLTAAKDIRAGQVVYESPRGQSLKTVDLAFGTKVCLHCGEVSCGEDGWGDFVTLPLQCHGCETAAWCSARCQEADAPLHALTCRFVRPVLRALRRRHAEFMAAAEPVEWTEGVNLLTLLAIVCLRAQHLGLAGCSKQRSVPPSLYDGIKGMVTNVGRWPPGTRHMTLLRLWSACIFEVLPDSWMPPPAELEGLTCALTCNVFSMWLPDFASYGSVVEPWAALINHSCTPNLARVQVRLYVRLYLSTRDLSPNSRRAYAALLAHTTHISSTPPASLSPYLLHPTSPHPRPYPDPTPTSPHLAF